MPEKVLSGKSLIRLHEKVKNEKESRRSNKVDEKNDRRKALRKSALGSELQFGTETCRVLTECLSSIQSRMIRPWGLFGRTPSTVRLHFCEEGAEMALHKKQLQQEQRVP